MGEIRGGRDVMDALRLYPLSDGGYLGKYVLVAAYHQMVRAGEIHALLAQAYPQARVELYRTAKGEVPIYKDG